MMKSTVFFLFALVVAWSAAFADPPLPTRDFPIEKCEGAVVASLVSIGVSSMAGVGQGIYESRWKVSKTLRGEYPADAEFFFYRRELPAKARERAPTVGQTYILVTYPNHKKTVASVFEYTDKKLQEVQQILEAGSH